MRRGLGAVVALVAAVLLVPTAAQAGTREPSSPAAPVVRKAVPARPVAAAPKPKVPLPARSGSGRRVVYVMGKHEHVWLVEADGRVVRDMPGSGRADWPRAGTYHVFSQSRYSSAPGLTFAYMTRFAHGRTASIGFHTIPRYNGSGRLTHPVSQLGLPVGHGGCVHLADKDAAYLYHWAHVGTTVVVIHT
jgi:lipoprotein-anchoring transpeptidase ErfK/SrfK